MINSIKEIMFDAKCPDEAVLFGYNVLHVNSVCLDREGYEIARGGAAYFLDGNIKCETPAGEESILYVKI